jgi:hypothetical protein
MPAGQKRRRRQFDIPPAIARAKAKRVLARTDNLHNHRSLRKAEAEPRSCLNAPGLVVRLLQVCLPHSLSAKPPQEAKVAVRVTLQRLTLQQVTNVNLSYSVA